MYFTDAVEFKFNDTIYLLLKGDQNVLKNTSSGNELILDDHYKILGADWKPTGVNISPYYDECKVWNVPGGVKNIEPMGSHLLIPRDGTGIIVDSKLNFKIALYGVVEIVETPDKYYILRAVVDNSSVLHVYDREFNHLRNIDTERSGYARILDICEPLPGHIFIGGKITKYTDYKPIPSVVVKSYGSFEIVAEAGWDENGEICLKYRLHDTIIPKCSLCKNTKTPCVFVPCGHIHECGSCEQSHCGKCNEIVKQRVIIHE